MVVQLLVCSEGCSGVRMYVCMCMHVAVGAVDESVVYSVE